MNNACCAGNTMIPVVDDFKQGIILIRYKDYIYLEPQGQPLVNGCFNWMIPNLYIGNCWKSPFPSIFNERLALGFQNQFLHGRFFDSFTNKNGG